MIFEFTITFSIEKWDADEISEQVFGSGIHDALVLTGIKGVVGLDVFRESTTAMQAIESVVQEILKIYPDAELLEVKPDIVSKSEIASFVGHSRQNINKLVGFPPPTITGSKPYWHLYQVVKWYESKNKFPFPAKIVETSKAAWMVNQQLEKRRLEVLL